MQLTEAQNCELLRKHGAYITEACDGCGKILGHVRFTRYGEAGEWCSRLCRDGIEHKAGSCRSCGADLKGKRKGALFYSDVCRKRRQVQDQKNNAEMPIQKSALTDAISVSGYEDGLEVERSLGVALIERFGSQPHRSSNIRPVPIIGPRGA